MGLENREPEVDTTKLYNLSQLFLIRYQIAAGIIKSPEEYVVNGTAALFDLVAHRHLECTDVDWIKAREEVKQITGGVNESIIKMHRP